MSVKSNSFQNGSVHSISSGNDDLTTAVGPYVELKTSYEQWSLCGNEIYASNKVVKKIPCGQYEIKYDYQSGQCYLKYMEVTLSDLFDLPNKIHEEIIDDIRHFWASKERYKQFGNIYKRNLLLYSSPGNGKTSIINLIIDDLIKNQDGFVLRIKNVEDLNNYNNFIKIIKVIEPNRNIIVVMEDFEDLVRKIDSESLLLNILDGVNQTENVLILATTNYPERLEERYLNRPTRFNRVIEYPKPDEKVREFYIRKKLNKSGIQISDEKILEYVNLTKQFTMDHLKEFLQMIYVDEYDENEAAEKINTMLLKKGKYRVSDNKTQLGYSNGVN